jgi:hypothetical protein
MTITSSSRIRWDLFFNLEFFWDWPGLKAGFAGFDLDIVEDPRKNASA